MEDYPYTSAVILTDPVYVAYGGFTKSSTPAQRLAAYAIAEQQMCAHLGTFLQPTIVTGTYGWPMPGKALVLRHSHVRSILSVTAINGYCECEITESEACAFEQSDLYGYLYVRQTAGVCGGCHGAYASPYQVRVVYQAGLNTGTSCAPAMLLALTMTADIIVKEIADSGALEGGAGDPGVLEWDSQEYSEKRKMLGNFVFGNSPRANKIARLVMDLRPKRALQLR